MALTINGTAWANGRPVLVGGVQAQRITANGTEVWVNNQPPSTIGDFNATSSGVATVVTVTFTPASGVPTPTQDLYENDVLVASSIGSGHAYTSAVGGLNSYHVKSVNVAGTTSSNAVSTEVYVGGASPLVITANTTLVAGVHFPANTALTACMAGGGGSGAATPFFYMQGGGHAGASLTTTRNVPGNTQFVVTIGAGGAAFIAPVTATNGNPGGDTVFDGTVAAGGAGGTLNEKIYNGNGGTKTSVCGGVFNDGLTVNGTAGGEAGAFGNGGLASTTGAAEDGGISAGGGSVNGAFVCGAGGRGQVVLSW